MTPTAKPDPIFCAGGCKRNVEDTKAAEEAGWSFLHITGRYRCGICERELRQASTAEGAPPRDEVDTLPPNSIGALKQMPERQPMHEKVKP